MEQKFEEKNLEKCLQLAEENLLKSRKDFQYTIISEEKGFMKKHCVILVTTENDVQEEVEKALDFELDLDLSLEQKIKDLDSEDLNCENDNSESVLIEGDRIIIKEQDSEIFELQFKSEIKIFINGESAKSSQKVTSKDEIKYEASVTNGKRELNIKSSNMEAKVSIKYVPEYVEKLICEKMGNIIKISSKMVRGQSPPLYTKEEIINVLKERKVVSGFVEGGLKEASSSVNVDGVIIAKGLAPVNDGEDEIEVLFQNTKRIVDENSRQKMDYRNLYSIANVNSGCVLGELKVGKQGNDGMDIYGNVIPKKLKKNLQLKVSNGCKIEGNKVISTIEGQPTVKGGTFFVNQVFQASADVDLKSGDIIFIGDVKVAKNVLEGMRIEAGNSVTIGGNVESATIIAQGETRISGNVINSKIHTGATNMQKQNYKEDLGTISNELKLLITYANEIKDKKLLGNRSDGEIIKVLIENKCKTLPKKAMKILSYNEGVELDNIKKLIRTRLLGLGPLDIKAINDLYPFVKLIEKELKPLDDNLLIPADVYINYVQDSEIESTGNIYITGKGQYTSNLSAFGDIIVTTPNSISRGGKLSAKGKIEARTVGSTAGVSTILKVPRGGEITADIAYSNTTFYFGERSYTLETSSKNVRAYIDKDGEIIVDKFVL